MTASSMIVTIGEIQVFKGPALFSCLGLGSCIGLCMLDPHAGVAGMAHILLPESFDDGKAPQPGRFADLASHELLSLMERLGADSRRVVAAYAGGAQVFSTGSDGPLWLDIGARNAQMVERTILELGLRCLARDVGGSQGRTVTFDTDTGEVRIRTVTGGDRELCNLKGSTR